MSAFGGEADVEEGAALTAWVVDDPSETSGGIWTKIKCVCLGPDGGVPC
jgi:hypothetical protein